MNQKILGSEEYFYHKWWKEDVYVKALSEAVEEFHGAARIGEEFSQAPSGFLRLRRCV